MHMSMKEALKMQVTLFHFNYISKRSTISLKPLEKYEENHKLFSCNWH